MDTAQARREAERMADALRVFKNAEDVLSAAAKAENTLAVINKDISAAQAKLSAVQADAELASQNYSTRQREGLTKLESLQSAMAEVERAHQAKLDEYTQQIKTAEENLDALKRKAETQLRDAQIVAQAKQQELEEKYKAQMAQYQLNEQAAKTRLESVQTELNALLKRVSG